MNEKYHADTVKLNIQHSYSTMLEVIEKNEYVVAIAKKAIKNVGLEPVSRPVRGGTDGARLSFMGLPCPNLGTGGYEALGKVLTEMTPDDVIQTLMDSGLRGRGGGGFPTGLKWKLAKQNDADQKYVCCNADEGDPGAFMDRSILEGDPHAVLEAMAIAG